MSRASYYQDHNGQYVWYDGYSTSSPYQDSASPGSSNGSSPRMATNGGNGDAYVCLYPGCPSTFGRATDLNRHQLTVHANSTTPRIDCQYKWCGRTGDRGFTRQDHYRDHLREVHQVQIDRSRRGPSRAAH